jgi:hypothetical protein
MSQSPENPEEFATNLWKNWQEGTGRCKGCPAQWSEHQDLHDELDDSKGDCGSSHGLKPWFADGKLKDVDIVILGEEPGPPKFSDEKWKKEYNNECFDDIRDPDISNVPDGGVGSIALAKPLFKRLDKQGDDFNIYWSQAKKCNEISDYEMLNNQAQYQCAGVGQQFKGYLKKEIELLDPDYIITLGKDACNIFTFIFEQEESVWADNFSDFVFNRDNDMRCVNSFHHIPLPHPSRGVHSNIKDHWSEDINGEIEPNYYDEDEKNKITQTEHYYHLVAGELIEQHNSETDDP